MIFVQNRSRIEVPLLFHDLNHEIIVLTILPWGQWVTMGFNVRIRLLMQAIALVRHSNHGDHKTEQRFVLPP